LGAPTQLTEHRRHPQPPPPVAAQQRLGQPLLPANLQTLVYPRIAGQHRIDALELDHSRPRGTLAGMEKQAVIRRVRIAVSLFFGVLTVALCVLWVRSYSYSDQWHIRYWGKQSILLASKSGRIVIVAHESLHYVRWTSLQQSYSVDDELSFPTGKIQQYETFGGFGVMNQPAFDTMPADFASRGPFNFEFGPWDAKPGAHILVPQSLNGRGIMMPYWFAVLLLAVSFVVSLRFQRPCQFSLRTMLIATTLVAVVLGLSVWLAR
jgi:hypothetical protein